MNSDIRKILVNDESLYNRVYGYGPGSGLNRMMVTVEDQASIDTYGLRETTQDFPNATSYDELETLTQAYLDDHKEVDQDIELTYFFYLGSAAQPLTYNGELVTYNGQQVVVETGAAEALPLERGDTVRVSSLELGAAFTARVEELDWQPGSVDLILGTPTYNLIDVINGPKEEEERKREALGLPVPIGLRVFRASPGITMVLNPYANSRAIGSEVYASTVSPVASTRDKLIAKGPGTQFNFTDLEPGVVYYFKARAYDAKGNLSGFTDEVFEAAGYIDGGNIGEGSLDITPFASGLRPPRNVYNLPAVPPTVGWLVGDLAVYAGELYELKRTTGDPTDWEKVSAGDLEGKSVAHQIVAGQIIAGAIGADQIAARAITAGKIAAGAITLDSINYDVRNFVPNPGFEQTPNGEKAGDPVPIWEQAVAIGGSGVWVLNNNTPFSGTWCASTRPLDGNGDGLYATHTLRTKQIPINPGDQVSARVMLRAASAAFRPYFFEIMEYTASGAYNGRVVGKTITDVEATWEEHTISGEASAAAASYRVAFRGLNYEVQGPTVYVDGFISAPNYDASRQRIKAGTSRVDGTGFETRDASGDLQTKMGYIKGYPGVPNTNASGNPVEYGFWGTLGTGVFIQGAPMVVDSFTEYISTNETTDVVLISTNHTVGDVTIPTGKAWVLIASPTIMNVSTVLYTNSLVHTFENAAGTTSYGGLLPAGSYTGLRVESTGVFAHRDGISSAVFAILEVTYLIVEIGA